MPAESVLSGDVWAVPAGKHGWCPAVVARTPVKNEKAKFALIYVRLVATADLPTPRSVPPLEEWSESWVGLTVLRPFNTNRWTRVGTLDGFVPAEWPVPPTARRPTAFEVQSSEGEREVLHGASIEVTADRPTMTLIGNTPTTAEDVHDFPEAGVITAPSRFEDGLERLFDDRRSNPMHDMAIASIAVSPERVARWKNVNAATRANPQNNEPTGLPPGRKTDRELRRGAWIGLPLASGGFGLALVALKPPKHLRFFSDAVVMAIGRRWDRWPTFADAMEMTPDDVVFCGQTSMICVRDGRWRVLGYDESIDNEHWPVPIRWGRAHQEKVAGRIGISFGGESRTLDLDPALIDSDPGAGSTLGTYWSYRSIESIVARCVDGIATENLEAMRVTPQRIRAWRAINQSIADALGASPATFYDDE